jgi:hypothetical protein
MTGFFADAPGIEISLAQDLHHGFKIGMRNKMMAQYITD